MGPRSLLEVLMVCALCGVLACAAQAGAVTAVRCAKPPNVDGRLDDACWRNAAVVSEFALASGEAAPGATEARICFDDDGLYLAFACAQAETPKADATGRDLGVLDGDCVDVYLDPTHDRFNYFHFAVNAVGGRFDERGDGVGVDPKWDTPWQAASARSDEGWTCEIALPWTALDPMSSFRPTMGLNLVRRFASGEIATWAPVGNRLQSTDKWGDLAGLDVDFSPFFVKVHLPALIAPCVGKAPVPFRVTDALQGQEVVLWANWTARGGVEAGGVEGGTAKGVTPDEKGEAAGTLDLHLPQVGAYRIAFTLAPSIRPKSGRAGLPARGRPRWAIERVVECKPVAHVTVFESFYRDEVKVRVIAGEQAGKVRLRLEAAGPQGFAVSREQEHAVRRGEQSFSMPVGDLQPGEYEITAEFEDASGEVGQRERLPFYRSHDPGFKNPRVDIRDDNMLVVEGKPFFPIALYAPTHTDEGYADAAAKGYNVVRSSEKYLDLAQKHGLKVWLNIGGWLDLRQNRERNLKGLADFTARVKDHPALAFYESQDEPTWRELPLDLFVEGYHELKRLDPDHPIWTNHAPRNTVEDLTIYARSSDIIGTDMYPSPDPQAHSDMANKTLAVTGEETDKQRLTVGDTKPVFMVIQGFSWGEILTDPINKANPRYPTYEELRFIAYHSIVRGARGLLYWGTHSIERPDFWDDLTRVTRELGKMAPVLAWRDDAEASEAAVVSGPIDALVKCDNGRRVLIAVNRTGKPARATMRVRGFEQVGVLSEGREVKASAGEFTDDFGPYGVHIYAPLELIAGDGGPAAPKEGVS